MKSRLLIAAIVLLASSAYAFGNGAPQAAQAAEGQLQQQTVTVEELLREAHSKHPTLFMAAKMVEAGRARVVQASALPDPTVSVGWMGRAVPFRVMGDDPSSYRSIGAMQEFPLGGKRALRGQMAQRELEASTVEVEDAHRRITAQVKAAYYDYFYFTRALEITGRNRELMQKLSKIAEARYQVGKTMQADVLRAHVELSRLQQKLTMLEQQKQTAVARLNALLLRPAEAAMPLPAAPQLRELTHSVDSLFAMAKESDTELRRRRTLQQRGELGIKLAQKERVPDLGVGYMFQQRAGMQDMHGVTFTVNIPLFNKAQRAAMVSEATAEAQVATLAIKDREVELMFMVREQYLMAKASEELLRLFAEGVVPQSSLALESSLAAYEVGSTDFMTLITNFQTVLDYETEYFRELANHKIALSRLEPLVGVELTN